MKKSYRLALVSLILVVAHVVVPLAAAHPLGNFTINHYAGLRVTRDAVAIDYVLDMAEIPAFQEIAAFDANRNGLPDTDEAARYHPAACEAIRTQLELNVAGQSAPLALESSAVEFPAGAGGLLTLRLSCAFHAAITSDAEIVELDFQDRSYAERLGWREIVVTGDGVPVQGDFASSSISRRLTAYPDDLLTSPLDQRQVSIALRPAGATDGLADRSSAQPGDVAVGQPLSRRDDVFTRLIALPELNLATLVFAVAVSFVWGALHAMSPGHGKTMVAAYLVGTRGTTRHAVVLGMTVTLTHTIGVFALGLVVLFASNTILPEQLYPYLSLASGLLVLAIGLTLLVSRARAARSGRGLGVHVEHSHDHHGHAHGRVHHHHSDHDHAHAHEHEAGRHVHTPVDDDGRITLRSLLALGISGGLIPCPTALVVLLSAVALGRVGFGMLLIVAFSAGLAAVLMGIGLLLVHGHRLFDRLPVENRWLKLIPLTGACLVIVTGVVMTAQAIASVGTLSA